MRYFNYCLLIWIHHFVTIIGKKNSVSSRDGISCPNEFNVVQNQYCYHWSTTPSSWDEASSVCDDMNGWLVVIKSIEQNDGLLQWLEDSGMTFATFFSGPYIGIRRFDTSTTDFMWSHEPDRNSSFTNWKTKIPYISNELDNCGVMTADGTWFNFKCEDDRDFVCQTSVGRAPTIEPTAGVMTFYPTVITADATDSNDDNVTKLSLSLHLSSLFIILSFIAFTYMIYSYRTKFCSFFRSGDGGTGLQQDDVDSVNSSHNLVEMETMKSYGEKVERHVSDEIDIGGCFAFGNSSAEEMLASQLNVKVYSSVQNDLNAS